MPSSNNIKPIALGDVVEHISQCLYAELEGLLAAMRMENDPEYRTQLLRGYLSKARKVVCQMHCIASWLKSPDVIKAFSQSNEHLFQLQTIRDSLAFSQDSLFFIHRDIFPKRSRPYEIAVAKDVLARGMYASLPDAIANVGHSAPPKLLKNTLQSDLNIYIRAKLHLHDEVPLKIKQFVSVDEGKMIIHIPNLYELQLTLSCLNETADWIVLGCKILVKSHLDEVFYASYDKLPVDRDFLEIVRYHSTPSLPSTEEEQKNSTSIAKFHTICEHVSMSIALRLFYIQAQSMSMSFWKGNMEVEYHDVGIVTMLTVKFWRGQISGEYLYEMRLIQPRKAQPDGSLYIEMWCLAMTERDSTRIHKSHIEDIPIETFVLDGTSFSKLWDTILLVCGNIRLWVTYKRLIQTYCIQRLVPLGLGVELTDMRISIRFRESVGLSISLSAQTGKLSINADDLKTIDRQSDSIVAAFEREINNLDIERISQQLLTCAKVSEDDQMVDHDERSSLLSISGNSIFHQFSTAQPLLVHLLMIRIIQRVEYLTRLSVSPSTAETLLKYLRINPSAHVGIVFKVNSYISRTSHSLSLQLPTFHPQRFITCNPQASTEYFDHIANQICAVPDIVSYMIITLSFDFECRCYGLMTFRQPQESVLKIPSKFEASLISSLQLTDDDINIEKSLDLMNHWVEHTIEKSKYESKSIGFPDTNNVYQIYLPQLIDGKSNLSPAIIVSNHGKYLEIDLLYSSAARLTSVTDKLGNGTVDADNKRTIYENAIDLGKYIVSIHSETKDTSVLAIEVEKFDLGSCFSNLSSEDKYSIESFAICFLNILVSTINSNDDEDDDEPKQAISSVEYSRVYPVEQIRDKILLSVSKIFPLLGVLVLGTITPCLAYRDAYLPHALYRLQINDFKSSDSNQASDSRLFDMSVECAMSRNRISLTSNGSLKSQQSLVPTSKVIISDLAHGVKGTLDVTSAVSDSNFSWDSVKLS